MELLAATTPEQLDAFCGLLGSASLTPNTPSIQQADAHFMVQGPQQTLARCSLWWTYAPVYPGHRLGLIGHYAAQDGPAASLLLDHACQELALHGCSLAIGPMDGNTFRHYRLVTERRFEGSIRPPFFLEPDNRDSWPAHFEQAGFQPLARYVSAIGPLPEQDPQLAALTQHAAEHDVKVRPLDMTVFDLELPHIYTVVIRSFQRNFLYTPIGQTEFIAQYTPIRRYIDPHLVWLAEQNGTLAGFIFAVPDLSQSQRGEAVDTIVIKTVAVAPEFGGMGIGSLLTACCQTAARAQGYRFAIHALMHEDNISRKISAHYARIMRRYTLFARQL